MCVKFYKMSGRVWMALILILTLTASGPIQAQKKISSLAYAITGDAKGTSTWNMIRLIDLSTGEEKKLLLNGRTLGLPLFDATSGRQLSQSDIANMPSAKFGLSAMGAGVAAAAYDKRHNRLYFTPLNIDQLRWIDLNTETPRIFCVMGIQFNPEGNMPKEENMITRMVIAADGYGYALTNDANHLVRFSTSRPAVVTDLGAITDGDKNEGVSIHNKCTSWGGDMISDALNNLYLFSNGNGAFKIDIRTRKASWLGAISGIPPTFTTNGAAVLENGDIILSSAYSTDGYYKLDLVTLKATKISSGDKVFNTSDLATGNLANDNLSYANNNPLPSLETVVNERISVYPNPVSNGSFRLSFNDNPAGEYHVQVMDYMGRQVQSKKILLGNKNQVEPFQLARSMAKGVYMVKVTDWNRQIVFSDKIIVQ